MCHNIVDVKEIIKKSTEPICEELYLDESCPKLLTIGRFTSQKGFDLAIEASRLLKNENINFKWFFIGSGEQEKEYRALISKLDVEDRIIILGRKDNPYPYLKACDIYVHPSRHEAYAMVLLEAKVLKKAIICSRFAGAEEQIVNGKTGIIVSIGNVVELAESIKTLLGDSQTREMFSKALEKERNEYNDWENIKKHF